MKAVREFEEHAMASSHQSLVKEAAKYAEELIITPQLDTLNPVCVTREGKVVTAARAGNLLKQSQEKQFLEIAKDKKWQGNLFRNQPTRTPRVRRFGIFPSMQSTTKLEQIG